VQLELFKFHLAQSGFLAMLVQYSVLLSVVTIFAFSISNRHSDIVMWSNAAFSLSATLSIFVFFFMGKPDMYSYSIYRWSLISPIIMISLMFASKLWFLIAACLLGGLHGIFLSIFSMSIGELTTTRERGRVGGFIGFASILIMSFLTVVSSVFGFAGSVVLCSILSVCPFLVTRLSTMSPVKLKAEKAFSFKVNRWIERDYFLYLMPWLIYNLVNAILGRYGTTLVIDRLQTPIVAMILFSDVTSCMGALVGGFVADMYGRKKALGIGLTSYGISTALSGLIFLERQNDLLVFVLSALNGLSWGIFLVLYFLVVWQDLSNIHNSFFYCAGIGFYPLSMGLAQFLPPNMQFSLVNLSLFSCVLIFSSNAFLVAAKELLSPELRKEFDLFVYLEQVKGFLKKHYREPS